MTSQKESIHIFLWMLSFCNSSKIILWSFVPTVPHQSSKYISFPWLLKCNSMSLESSTS